MLCVTKRALCTAVKASQLPGDPFHTDRRDKISSKNSFEQKSCECMDVRASYFKVYVLGEIVIQEVL